MSSKYFADYEIECHCGCGRGVQEVSPVLLEKLDALREMYGKPIYCTNMYRCPEHNRAVGGVADSQHTLGTAADIYVDGSFCDFARVVLDSQLFNAVGLYYNDEFVHVDIRPAPYPNWYRW